jgi:NAD(P)-dependent dehydrogenase (short-subunit alcohol dehydrogenase family)
MTAMLERAMSQIFSIDGQNVVITGGTAGIGLGVARHFVGAGARVVITGRRDQGASIADAVGARFVPLDVSDSADIERGFAAIASLLDGRIDTLILNAGIAAAAGELATLDGAALRTLFAVNVFGVAECLRTGLPMMRRGASVIVTSSPASVVHTTGSGAYSASKAAVNSIVRTSAIELAVRNIRVNAVFPGVVRSELAFDPDALDEEIEMLRHFAANGIVRAPEEMGPVFQFLASNASATCTGALLACDDGVTAGVSPVLIERAFRAPQPEK